MARGDENQCEEGHKADAWQVEHALSESKTNWREHSEVSQSMALAVLRLGYAGDAKGVA